VDKDVLFDPFRRFPPTFAVRAPGDHENFSITISSGAACAGTASAERHPVARYSRSMGRLSTSARGTCCCVLLMPEDLQACKQLFIRDCSPPE